MTVAEFVNIVRGVRCWPYRITAEGYGTFVVLASSIKTADPINGEPIQKKKEENISALVLRRIDERSALMIILRHLEKHASSEIQEFFTFNNAKPFQRDPSSSTMERHPMGDRDEYLDIPNIGLKIFPDPSLRPGEWKIVRGKRNQSS